MSLPGSAVADPDNQAIVLSYQKINEDDTSASSIRQSLFIRHIKEMLENDIHIMPLPVVLDHIRNNRPLPPKTAAITFDGGFRSTYNKAMRLLVNLQIPFTVFLDISKMSDNAYEYTITRDELAQLQLSDLVTFGILYLPDNENDTTTDQGQVIQRKLNRLRSTFRRQFDQEPALLALLPAIAYNIQQETSENTIKAALTKSILTGVFAEHPGVIHNTSDFYNLPRFLLNDENGQIDRFNTILNASYLPARDISITNQYTNDSGQIIPPSFGFTVYDSDEINLDDLSCNVSSKNTPDIHVMGGKRIEIRFDSAFDKGSGHLSCILPHRTSQQASHTKGDDSTVWQWLSIPYYISRSN